MLLYQVSDAHAVEKSHNDATSLFCSWEVVGLYGAPHRLVTASLTFGMIFQQAVFPTLARSWRDSPTSARGALDAAKFLAVAGRTPRLYTMADLLG